VEPAQPALVEADDEGVAGDPRAEEIGEPLGERDPAAGAERLAAPQPQERVVGQTLAQRDQPTVKRVPRREGAGVEPITSKRATPQLPWPQNWSSATVSSWPQRPVQRFGPGRRAVSGVDPAEPAVEANAR
jgi:hypothetical protein